ncbi:response regulator [Tanticharoenia sakaeratensis]|uniref:Response regulator receiver protein n=1 Tax=Tanticharoenia sakaeratensis NBRC 103193 TaxID=1231623 RepID=A0A0D6MKJ2_9PROT|nr:response regulator [Tanticharoenia sakaeratensis]GAN54199.1 response regulator receiver protein [Tanticharoenia sakaeratensis NBRC 103193]GBQ19314.1 two component response regulator [Tanticharoenia sakaeratensis NBRC 103193]
MTERRPAGATPRTVLVVEDDALVRLLAVELLKEAGHSVHQAPNARTALRLLKSNPEIDTLFTDVSMPIGMDGVRLVGAVREAYPDIQVIVTSGARHPKAGDMPLGGVFLPKPYEPAHVLAAIGGAATA